MNLKKALDVEDESLELSREVNLKTIVLKNKKKYSRKKKYKSE
jgi:hypothetical protein